MTITLEQSAHDVSSWFLATTLQALEDCGREPISRAYVAAGSIAWDDCCGMLVVAPERVYRSVIFPTENNDEDECFGGYLTIDLLVLLVRCVPTVDDRGRAPSSASLQAAYQRIIEDAAVVMNAVTTDLPDTWVRAAPAQTFIGAEGGCIGVETRFTIGLEQPSWAICCAEPTPHEPGDPICLIPAQYVSFEPCEGLTSLNVQDAICELAGMIGPGPGPVAAEDVSFVPCEGIDSTNVQDAICEVASQISVVSNLTGEPMGHPDRSASTISFDNSSRTFTIAPTGASFSVWVQGQEFVFTTPQTIVIPSGSTNSYMITFTPTGALAYYAGGIFPWNTDAPTAWVYWNDTTGKAEWFADERHGVVTDWQTHEYLHRTRGAALANGLRASNFILGGDGSTNAMAQFDLSGGTFFDEDLQIDIVADTTPTAPFEQILTPATIPMYYRLGSGAWQKDAPTPYPVKAGVARPVYNRLQAGIWSTPDLANNRFGLTFICATSQPSNPVVGILGQDVYTNVNNAQSVDFADLDLSGFPSVEFRPLVRIVYEVRDAYTNTPKASIYAVDAVRTYQIAGQ